MSSWSEGRNTGSTRYGTSREGHRFNEGPRRGRRREGESRFGQEEGRARRKDESSFRRGGGASGSYGQSRRDPMRFGRREDESDASFSQPRRGHSQRGGPRPRKIAVGDTYDASKNSWDAWRKKKEDWRERRIRADFRHKRIFVQNLGPEVDWQVLRKHFESGPEGMQVAYSSVSLDDRGQSKGHGVVQFETADDAKAAITAFSGSILDGKAIGVREDRQEQRKRESRDPEPRETERPKQMPIIRAPRPPGKRYLAIDPDAEAEWDAVFKAAGDDVDLLEAELASAKKAGMSNRYKVVKHAKRRLFALRTNIQPKQPVVPTVNWDAPFPPPPPANEEQQIDPSPVPLANLEALPADETSPGTVAVPHSTEDKGMDAAERQHWEWVATKDAEIKRIRQELGLEQEIDAMDKRDLLEDPGPSEEELDFEDYVSTFDMDHMLLKEEDPEMDYMINRFSQALKEDSDLADYMLREMTEMTDLNTVSAADLDPISTNFTATSAAHSEISDTPATAAATPRKFDAQSTVSDDDVDGNVSPCSAKKPFASEEISGASRPVDT